MQSDSIHDQLKQASAGITFADFKEIMDYTPLSRAEWVNILNISSRSFLRYEKENKKFKHPQSDIILKVNELTGRGKEVFGSVQDFGIWLHNENYAFNGEKPVVYLYSIIGIYHLFTMLGRIEHGITA